ncbi:unnamed protein product [Rhodiola kirilowii]
MKSLSSKLLTVAVLSASLLALMVVAKTIDPYKPESVSLYKLMLPSSLTNVCCQILGVDKNASQRDIQKAFHKLSLKYHPDKNKEKGAQQKFEEINNAYEILSDEEKRKNYDLYGDEKGNMGFNGDPSGGYSSYTGGPQGHGFSFRPEGWQSAGGQGGSQSFSFSFGSPGGSGSSGFNLNDIFSNMFGGNMQGGSQFGGFGGSTSTRSQAGPRSSNDGLRVVTSQVFKKEISDKGRTWLLLAYTSKLKGKEYYESIVQEVANMLSGAIKVGSINCQAEQSFCNEHGLYPKTVPRLFVYSYRVSEGGSLVEYNDDLDAKKLKAFCLDYLPRFSKRVDVINLDISSSTWSKLPRVVLLSTKKDTPVIWRVLSGLYRKRFAFYDAQVDDTSNPSVKKLGVNALPAVVGWLSNGEKHILKTGITVKDLKSTVHELSSLLDSFEKQNKKVASSQAKGSQAESEGQKIPLLTSSNFDAICGEQTPVCIIGAFRSSKARDKLESILFVVSQKSLSRKPNSAFGSKDPVTYSLLDASKQLSFLSSFDKSGFKSSDKILIAYKPRKRKFAAYTGEMNIEETERFISSILNGDVKFSNTLQKPTIR